MRAKPTALLALFLLTGLLLPPGAAARTQTVLGSVTITGALPSELVGVVVDHNPGFEKTISLPVPPLTAPVFVDVDKDDMTGQIMNSRFETTVVLTNTTASPLTLTLTILDAGGTSTLATKMISVGPHATALVNISGLLP